MVTTETDLRSAHGNPDFKEPLGLDHGHEEYCDTENCEDRDTSAGWDLGYWCRITYSRHHDGSFEAFVSVPTGPTTNVSVTREQLIEHARHLMVLAGEPTS